MGRLRKPSLFAVVIAVAMLQSSDHAESAGVCDEITKSALVSVLSEIGGNVVDPIMTVSDALLDYFTNPDDKRLNAALSTLVEGGTSIVFPAYGVAIGTGRGVHNATNFTVNEMINSAQSGQIQAFICGGPSVGNLFSRVNFFDLKAMKGINCDNFNDKVTTFAHLEKIKALWFGYYARQLTTQFPGKENETAIREMLNAGWIEIENSWKRRWAEVLFAQLRAKLKREAEAAATRKACGPAVVPASSVHLDLVDAAPDTLEMVGWTVDAAGGLITQKNPAGWHAEYRWSPAPLDHIDMSGFTMKLSVSSQSIANNRLLAGIGAKSGLDLTPHEAHVEALSENGNAARADLSVTVTPPKSIDTWTTGMDVYLIVGADYGRSVIYHYKVAR
jgi:hypothetical protein